VLHPSWARSQAYHSEAGCVAVLVPTGPSAVPAAQGGGGGSKRWATDLAADAARGVTDLYVRFRGTCVLSECLACRRASRDQRINCPTKLRRVLDYFACAANSKDTFVWIAPTSSGLLLDYFACDANSMNTFVWSRVPNSMSPGVFPELKKGRQQVVSSPGTTWTTMPVGFGGFAFYLTHFRDVGRFECYDAGARHLHLKIAGW
jgi:hypothetical protein